MTEFYFTTMKPQVNLFWFIFVGNLRHQKDISKLSDLQYAHLRKEEVLHQFLSWKVLTSSKATLFQMHWHQHRCSKLCGVIIVISLCQKSYSWIDVAHKQFVVFTNCAPFKFSYTRLCRRGSILGLSSCSLLKMKLFLTLNFF